MLRIPCPWCGERDETEFRYRGDASSTPAGGRRGPRSFHTRTSMSGTTRSAGISSGGCTWAAAAGS